LKSDLIIGDGNGIPKVDKAGFLFSSDIPEERIKNEFPSVWRYLEYGKKLGICDRYICRKRSPWYSQEKRRVSPILCTYMGRMSEKSDSRPFRFILNRSKAIAANVYLMLYPKLFVAKNIEKDPLLLDNIWLMLQSLPIGNLVKEGRVYGGGLHKMEPKELLNAPVEDLSSLFPHASISHRAQMSLF
jgi:hypothetical protein